MAGECGTGDKLQQFGIPRDFRVVRSLRLIEAELNNPHLTVTHLAEKLHISTSRLRQLFALELGVGPSRYIRELRLSRARTLLEDSSLSIKEVMAAAGYNDPSHFSRDFKKHFGILPSLHRQSLHAKEYEVKRD
jgi:AraC family transcriptional regulator, glycine betaine-responsive activator